MNDESDQDPTQDPTQTGELGPMPTPQVEPGETSPGGPDSVAAPEEVIAADLDPDKNPATDESPAPLKESLETGEDTATEATSSDVPAGEADGESHAEESPA